MRLWWRQQRGILNAGVREVRMQAFNIEDIIHEDEDIIVCRKHAGMAVQSARSSQLDMESALRNYLSQKSGEKAMPYIGIIQRLDQPVEGVIIFAKNVLAARDLSRQIQQNQIEKIYTVMVKGIIEQREGVLKDFLLKDGRSNTSSVVSKATKGCKEAILSYKAQEIKGQNTILKINLQTGRHHQIRVQLANAKMPIMGDRKYNPEDKETSQLALCASLIKFRHPKTGKEKKFEILPENPVFY